VARFIRSENSMSTLRTWFRSRDRCYLGRTTDWRSEQVVIELKRSTANNTAACVELTAGWDHLASKDELGVKRGLILVIEGGCLDHPRDTLGRRARVKHEPAIKRGMKCARDLRARKLHRGFRRQDQNLPTGKGEEPIQRCFIIAATRHISDRIDRNAKPDTSPDNPRSEFRHTGTSIGPGCIAT